MRKAVRLRVHIVASKISAKALCVYPATGRHGRYAEAPASWRALRCAWKGLGASPPAADVGADLGGSSNPSIHFT